MMAVALVLLVMAIGGRAHMSNQMITVLQRGGPANDYGIM